MIQSLDALVALAHIDLGEAALAMADALDAQALVGQDLQGVQFHMAQLEDVHARIARPGASIYSAAMGVLGRQFVAGKGALQDLQVKQAECDHAVSMRRQGLHEHQRRYEGLSECLNGLKAERAAELEKREAVEREDLFLVRRYLLEERE